MEGPAFEVIEVFDDHRVERTFSLGHGDFQRQSDDAPTNYAFSVLKNSTLGKLDVTIWNGFLRDTLALTETYEINLPFLLQKYNFLKKTLLQLATPAPSFASHENAKCLRLLTEHFLLDRKLFNGFNLEHLYNQGIISADHWQDMQHLSTLNDLQAIDDAFQKHCHSMAEETDDSDKDINATNFPSQKNHEYRRAAVEDKQEEYTMFSSTRQSTDYQVLRSIRNFYNKLIYVGDYSYDEGPVDFEKSYVWEPHKSDWPGVSQAEKETLAHICESNVVSEAESETKHWIISLIFSSSFIDISSLEGYGIVFHNEADIPFSTTSIRRLEKHEKEEYLTARLHSAFRLEDKRFRCEVRRIKRDSQAARKFKVARTDLTSRPFEFAYQRYRKAWNTGIAAIRRFLRGILPRNLEQICRLLQVAYAMGLQDPHNPGFRDSFAADLNRWRLIVPEGLLSSFDDIAKRVWNKPFHQIRSDVGPEIPEYGANENLLYLQQLLSGLISNNPLAEISTEDKQGDPQPNADRQRVEVALDSSLGMAQHLLGGIEDPKAYPHTRKLPICWKPAEPVIILMMAGAIFGSIFSFLLIFQGFASPLLSSQLSSLQNLSFTNFEERNLHILLLYLGLSVSSLWQEEKDLDIGTTSSRIFRQTEQEQALHPMEDTLDDEQEQALHPMEDILDTPMIVQPAYTDSVEQSPIAEPLIPSNLPMTQDHRADNLQCPRCNKKFSNIGNCNRHIRFDCDRRARFPCRNSGCKTVATRKAYRDKHENWNCPRRQAKEDQMLS